MVKFLKTINVLISNVVLLFVTMSTGLASCSRRFNLGLFLPGHRTNHNAAHRLSNRSRHHRGRDSFLLSVCFKKQGARLAVTGNGYVTCF